MKETIDDLLKKLHACQPATEWARGKTWQEIYNTCDKGDWLLWLFCKTNPNEKRLRVLVAGHCANTVRNLMKDKRSISAIDATIAYGEGKIEEQELKDAYAAYTAAAADAVAYAAKKKNQLETANIVRKYISIEKFNIG